jgi:methionine synthase II (cobalamin-independent)
VGSQGGACDDVSIPSPIACLSWHDRAVFHFLTENSDVEKYVKKINKFLNTGGHFIIATFSLDGPAKCSGLNIQQYSEDSIKEVFKEGFVHLKSFEEAHETPSGARQSFIWSVFRKD